MKNTDRMKYLLRWKGTAAACAVSLAAVLTVSGCSGGSADKETKAPQVLTVYDTEEETEAQTEEETKDQSVSGEVKQVNGISGDSLEVSSLWGPEDVMVKADSVGDAEGDEITVTSPTNVRCEPSITAAAIATMNPGTVVKAYGSVDGWVRIAFNGRVSYISQDSISSADAEAEAAREAEIAAQREAEEASRAAAEEAERQAAEEASRAAAEEESRRAAEEASRQAEEARQAAEEESRRAAEEASRQAAEEESRRAAEEESRRAAEEESRRAAEETQPATTEAPVTEPAEETQPAQPTEPVGGEQQPAPVEP